MSTISNSTLTAAASLPALRETRGYLASFSSLDCRSALPNSWVVISRSKTSSTSSTARASIAFAVAASTATRWLRGSNRRSADALPANP